jgi:hypothetical protein
MTALQKAGNTVADRLTSKDSPDFKPIKYVGAGLTVAGLIIKGVALFTPAMPLAAVSLAGDCIMVGLTLFGAAAYSKDQKNPNANVTTGKSGISKVWAIVKNLVS